MQIAACRVDRYRQMMMFWVSLKERLRSEGMSVTNSDYQRCIHFISQTSGFYFEARRELRSLQHEQSIMLRSGRDHLRP
jgi:hypothetical protein